jgi:hypothetical protein
MAISLVATLLVAPPAKAEPWDWRDPDTTPKDHPPERDTIGIFPIATSEPLHYSNTFLAARGGSRVHLGVDIMAYGRRGDPVVAFDDGVISWIGSGCCSLHITHDDGWQTRYIHLNDDRQDEDGSYVHGDDQGWGIAPGIVPGVRVTKGQLIGWVGDSGNATEGVTHLHWEIIYPNGMWHDPTPYVDRAVRLDGPLLTNWGGQFWDDEGSVHEANIDIMYNEGITRGCNPPDNDKFCPTREVTRGEMAAFLRRLLELPDVGTDYYGDDSESIFEGDINALSEEGIGFGCSATDYCPDAPLRREEMAELLVRTFGYDNPEGTDFFSDDGSSPFQVSINKLAANDITKGCNPPENTNFCPDRTLDRAEMATFIARALELGT